MNSVTTYILSANSKGALIANGNTSRLSTNDESSFVISAFIPETQFTAFFWDKSFFEHAVLLIEYIDDDDDELECLLVSTSVSFDSLS